MIWHQGTWNSWLSYHASPVQGVFHKWNVWWLMGVMFVDTWHVPFRNWAHHKRALQQQIIFSHWNFSICSTNLYWNGHISLSKCFVKNNYIDTMQYPLVSRTSVTFLMSPRQSDTCLLRHVTLARGLVTWQSVTLQRCHIRPLSRSVTEICNETLWETLDWCDDTIRGWELVSGRGLGCSPFRFRYWNPEK